VEDDVDVWCYAILELHARNDDDDALSVVPVVGTQLGHFTFGISLSLSVLLSLKFGLRPKISQKVEVIWHSQRLAERLAETRLRTERSLNPKLINLPVDFACTRYVG